MTDREIGFNHLGHMCGQLPAFKYGVLRQAR